MKEIILLGNLFLLLFFWGCFKDEGNYEYKDLGKEPTWLLDVDGEVIRVSGTWGQMMEFNPQGTAFTFGEDSAEMVSQFRYEWEANNVIFSNECNFIMETDSVRKKIGMENASSVSGSFRIINKETGAIYMARCALTFRSKYGAGDIIILSENGQNTKCSYLRRQVRQEGPLKVDYFEFEDNLYETLYGEPLPGKPLLLLASFSKQVSSSEMATVILTDKIAYLLNNETFSVYTDLKKEFLDGTPEGLEVVDMIDNLQSSYLISSDGLLYKRQLSENYLSGKFLTEPYYVDNKGYKITKVGAYVCSDMPPVCFDEKNRRLLVVQDVKVGRVIFDSKVVPLLQGENESFPVWDIPQNVDILHLGILLDGWSYKPVVVYNQGGKSYKYDFSFDSETMNVMKTDDVPVELPVHLNDDCIIITGASWDAPESKIFYTNNNELRCIDFNMVGADQAFIKVDSKITSVAITQIYNSYKRLIVGCENGDVYVFTVDLNLLTSSVLTKVNVGGKVTNVLETGVSYGYDVHQ